MIPPLTELLSVSSCKNLAGILRQETSRSAGSGVVFVLEAEFEALLETCVCSGAVEIPCGWLETGENERKAVNENAATRRENAKEPTIDEQFPLDRADRTGETASAFPSVKMTPARKRFAASASLKLMDAGQACRRPIPVHPQNGCAVPRPHKRAHLSGCIGTLFP